MTEELHIEKMAGVRFSDEGRTAHFKVLLGGRLAEISMPVRELPAIHAVMDGTLRALQDNEILPRPAEQDIKPVTVRSWKLGGNTFDKNVLGLVVNEKLPDETMLVWAKLGALQLADAIEQAVMDGMSEIEKKELLEAVERSTGRKSRLIIPRSGKLN